MSKTKRPARSRLTGKKSKKAPLRELDTVVTFLEMTAPPLQTIPAPVNLQLSLMRAQDITVGFYRYLYEAVGSDYHWVDRKRLNDDQLAAEINTAGIDVWVAYLSGTPAGYFEIDARNGDVVWLAYFGLIPDFHGRGLGKWLLSQAISAGWAYNPRLLRVETCTLDDPRALPLYQRMGFVPYERKEKVMQLLD